MFKELSKKEVKETEKNILKYWKDNKIFEKSIENRPDDNRFVFYDGPIYANAHPGLHHLYAKEIKDAFCRYKTMRGYKVLRRMGLDTHGLPVEVNVEKKLGFNGKADIEAFGIQNFIDECRNTTDTCIDDVKKLTNMMGQFIDMDDPYVTCSNNYIESEWWIINEMHKKGLIYQQNKVSPYCPRCGTDLSNFEVAQGYKDGTVHMHSLVSSFLLEGYYV